MPHSLGRKLVSWFVYFLLCTLKNPANPSVRWEAGRTTTSTFPGFNIPEGLCSRADLKSKFLSFLPRKLLWTFAAGFFLLPLTVQALDPSTLGEVGLNLGSNPYWGRPAFANALWESEGWLEYVEGQWGSTAFFEGNPQFDPNGFPKYLNTGKKLRVIVFALGANLSPRPSNWPDRSLLAKGKVVITWKGDADIRANGGTYLAAESSGASTGRLINGRRVYRFTGAERLSWVTVEAINAANPIIDCKVWLPDPSDPDNRALEEQFFHPTFLARVKDAPWAFLRMMDWNESNASPQQDWADRRLPTSIFQSGVLNRRAPASNFPGDRPTGVAFEHMVALCNEAGRDLWINVPHLATADFTTKLAQLIRFGSDGQNPYTSPVANPLYPPLKPALRVFIEYSNEIWSGGYSFAQGNWADDQALALGLTKAQFNARRFCDIWKIFDTVFGDENSRMVRVAAVFTGGQFYTDPFLSEMAAYGPTLSPPQRPDVVAPTTYFGNGIQEWVYLKARDQAVSVDRWFSTTNTFIDGNTAKQVSLPAGDGYWKSQNVARHMDETFLEWKRRLLSDSAQSGGGQDATGIGGGFDPWLRTSIWNAFAERIPIVSYEGGPALPTDSLDGGDLRDDGVTTFLELLNRQPQMADVYRIHLNLAKSKGLRTHGAYFDCGIPGKYGQWGHLEYQDEDPNSAVKWRFLRDWPSEVAGLLPVDDPRGNQPAFSTAARLASIPYGISFTQDILVTGGDPPMALQVIDKVLVQGLQVSVIPGAIPQLHLSGVPQAAGENFILARVTDADGDPAWKTFRLKVTGGPGTLVESNFEGENPARNLPWTPAYFLQEGASYSGWSHGAGIVPENGADGLFWSQEMPFDEADSTLPRAISEERYWEFTVTPPQAQPLDLRGKEVKFTIRRVDYHAPRAYAVFSSIGGFTSGAQLFDTGRFVEDTAREFVFTIPETAPYSNISSPVTFRIYGYGGQYRDHKTSLLAFRVASAPLLAPVIVAPPQTQSAIVGSNATFSVTAAGSSLTYRWFKDGNPLPGANDSTLLLQAVKRSDVANYTVVVENPSGSVTSDPVTLKLFSAVRVANALQRELYRNIPGSTIPDLRAASKFPDSPDRVDAVTLFESINQGDDYGVRLSGFVTPSITGSYTFYLASDDQSELYLSSDQAPEHKVLIATEPQWNNSRDWLGTARRNASSPENRSSPIVLTAGNAYYIEAIQKEGGSGDHVAVAWQRPGQLPPGNGSSPITSTYLSYTKLVPYVEPPAILTQPESQTVQIGGSAIFRVRITGDEPISYQWKLNGINLTGGLNDTLTLNPVTPSDAGDYTVLVSNSAGQVLSIPAQLTVLKLDQTITFEPISDRQFGDPPFALVAAADSKLPVTFTAVSGPIAIFQDTVTIIGAGAATIRAFQSGDTSYNAAAPIEHSFHIRKAGQSISFGPIPAQTVGVTFNPAAAASSGLPVEFRIVSGPATISGTAITPTGLGSVSVRASQNGNDNFEPAPEVDQSFQVDKELNTAPVLNTIGDKATLEGSELTFTASASDQNLPPQALSFALIDGPLGAVLDPTTGVFTWTPSEDQGPSTNTMTIRVTDNGAPALSASEVITLIVNEVNSAPILNPLENHTLAEGAVLVVNNVAADADLPAQTLSFSLGVGAPFGAVVDPASGVFTWTPGEEQGPGEFPISITASDNGDPVLSATQTFTVLVTEVNSAPTLNVSDSQSIAEGSPLIITNVAADSDIPAQQLSFSLAATAPVGATINSTNGVFTWTPAEDQGPGNYSIGITVADNGSPPLSTTQILSVTVSELNEPPVLSSVHEKTVMEGSTLSFTARATDSDLPAQILTFSLGPDTPAGATIDPLTGLFTWTPTEVQGPATNVISLVVTDDGPGLLGAINTFTVIVEESNSAPVLNAIGNRSVDEGKELTFTVSAIDSDRPVQSLAWSIEGLPPGATFDNSTGLFSWTPAETQGPGTNAVTLRVLDDGTPALSAAETFTIVVNELNKPPALSAIDPTSVKEGSLLTFAAQVEDLDFPAQPLTFSLDRSAPIGAMIDPSTGVFTWTPTEEQGPGDYSISIIVADNGSPVLTSTNEFVVSVSELNSAPMLALLSDQVIDEAQPLLLNAAASDPDQPANSFLFTLENGPAGLIVNSVSGAISWTPGEDQGPDTNIIRIRVTDDGTPALSDTKEFAVIVTEVNSAPLLKPIPDQTLEVGAALSLFVIASDPDLPPNVLNFALENPPGGLAIDPATGLLSWSPAETERPATNLVNVRVSDNGNPPLSDTKTFTIILLADDAPVALSARITGNQIVITWETRPNLFLHYTPNIASDSVWQPVPAPVTLEGNLSIVRDELGQETRFYRLSNP